MPPPPLNVWTEWYGLVVVQFLASASHWPNSVRLAHPIPLLSFTRFLSIHARPVLFLTLWRALHACPIMKNTNHTQIHAELAEPAGTVLLEESQQQNYQNYLQMESLKHHLQPLYICRIRLSSVPNAATRLTRRSGARSQQLKRSGFLLLGSSQLGFSQNSNFA